MAVNNIWDTTWSFYLKEIYIVITLSRFWPQSQTGDYDQYYYRDYTEDEEPIRDLSREEKMKSLYDKLYITYLNDKKMDKYGK